MRRSGARAGHGGAGAGSIRRLHNLAAEIEANNQKVKELASEQGLKVGQNVAAGVAGLVVSPLLFAMDFQDSAGKEVAALQSRQQYLTTLAEQRCASPAPAQTASVRRR